MLEIKNKDLLKITQFIRNDLVTEGAMENIHRMRLVKYLENCGEKLEEERIEIIKQYAKKDESGDIIQNEDGNVDIFNVNQMNRDLDMFFNEAHKISDPNLESATNTLIKLVKDFDGELSGDSGEAHYILVEALNINLEEA